MTEEKNKLDDVQIDLIVKELLKRGETTFGERSGLYSKIQRAAAFLGFLNIRPMDANNIIALSDEDFLRCTDRLWEYLGIGILAPGLNRNNPGFPWVHLTEYGKKLLIEEVNPYSAEKFVADIENIANILLDDIAEMYLFEALRCFRHNCYLGATVLLGSFSERVFLNFLVEFIKNIQDPSKKADFENKIKDKFIATKFNTFIKTIEPLKKGFPRGIKDQIDLWLSSFFNYIRRVRNDVGHPTGTSISRADILAMFLPFPKYMENLMKLIDYFSKNPIT